MWNIYALPKYHKKKLTSAFQVRAISFYCDARTCKRAFGYKYNTVTNLIAGYLDSIN